MVVQQTGLGTVGQQFLELGVGRVAVLQSRVEIQQPAHAPAGAAAAGGQAARQGLAGSFGELGRQRHVDLVGGEQAVQVGNMAVTRVLLRVVLDPLLYASGARADLQGRQPVQRGQ